MKLRRPDSSRHDVSTTRPVSPRPSGTAPCRAAREEAPARQASRLGPGRSLPHGLAQAPIRSRRFVQTSHERRMRCRAELDDGLIKQDFFGGGPRRVQHEGRAILAPYLGGTVDQGPFLGFDPKIERLSPRVVMGTRHGTGSSFSRSYHLCNSDVITHIGKEGFRQLEGCSHFARHSGTARKACPELDPGVEPGICSSVIQCGFRVRRKEPRRPGNDDHCGRGSGITRSADPCVSTLLEQALAHRKEIGGIRPRARQQHCIGAVTTMGTVAAAHLRHLRPPTSTSRCCWRRCWWARAASGRCCRSLGTFDLVHNAKNKLRRALLQNLDHPRLPSRSAGTPALYHGLRQPQRDGGFRFADHRTTAST
ncbi:MAG: hypothetical protein OJF55_001372 [Rhodanobacteraceae bacterium]|nr:MAG: hypothetical protein OJF55_001372 [Rhodanobacteraceae bacterium]